MQSLRYLLHIHTTSSIDSAITPERLYRFMCQHGIYGVAITDHNTIQGAVEFSRRYGSQFHVIVGEEVMTRQGEVIGLFLQEEVAPNQEVEISCRLIRDQGGLVCIPHPCDRKRIQTALDTGSIEAISSLIDFIEVYNGRCYLPDDNAKAELLASKFGTGRIFGSDAHTLYELRYNIVEVSKELTRANFKSVFKDASLLNAKTHGWAQNYTRAIKLLRVVRKGEFDEVCGIIGRRCGRVIQAIGFPDRE